MDGARCPKCRFAVGAESECPRCGIVLARFRSKAAAPGARAATVTTRRAAAARGRPWPLTWGAALLVTALAVAGWTLRPSAPTLGPSPPSEAQRVVRATALAPAPVDPAPPVASVAVAPAPSPLPSAAPAVTVSCPVDDARASGAPGRWPVSSSWHRGASGYERAQREQERSQAPMLVYFFTDWCRYCRAFEGELLSEWQVERYLRTNVVKVRVNPESSARDEALAQSFGVSGYPSLFLASGDSKTRVSIYGAGATALRAPEDFVGVFAREAARRGDALLRDGRLALDGGDPGRALKLLDAALAIDPERSTAYLQRGRARLARGDEQRGLSDLKAAASRAPRAGDAHQVAAEHFQKQRRWEESVACWDGVIERRATADAYLARALGHAQRGDPLRSREDAERACSQGSAAGCALAEASGPRAVAYGGTGS